MTWKSLKRVIKRSKSDHKWSKSKNALPLLFFAIDPEFQLRETLDSQNWKWKSAKVIYVTKWAPSKPKIAE